LLSDMLGVLQFQPFMLAMSLLVADLWSHIPSVSMLGWAGITAIVVIWYIMFLLCNWLRLKTQRKQKKAAVMPNTILRKIVAWGGWKWFVSAAMIVVGIKLIDFRPRLRHPYTDTTRPVATYREMQQSNIVGRTVIMTELAQMSDPKHGLIVSNMRFQECDFLGPCVIVGLGGTDFRYCGFAGAQDRPESILLERKGPFLNGEIIVSNCLFNRCSFDEIGVAVTADEFDNMRSSLTRGKNAQP